MIFEQEILLKMLNIVQYIARARDNNIPNRFANIHRQKTK